MWNTMFFLSRRYLYKFDALNSKPVKNELVEVYITLNDVRTIEKH
jgi:hypothetical protein